MKILHIDLLGAYTEGMLYQENFLEQYNRLDQHNVTFISDAHQIADGQIVDVPEEDRILENGTRLIRLKYDNLGHPFINRKIIKISKLLPLIRQMEPDVILYHHACGYEMINVAKYIEAHQNVLLYMDAHTDFNNTARTFPAKLYYKLVNGIFLKKALPQVKKILYITYEVKLFLQKMYHIPEEKLEFFPQGGTIVPKEEQKKRRELLIQKYGWPEDVIICAHSGKMVETKYTKELLEAFSLVEDDRLRMLVFGSIPKDREELLLPLIEKDQRILFLGWKSGDEILDLLAGTDFYCQPGTQSSTFQAAVCAGCAVMLYPYESYQYIIGEAALYCDRTVDSIRKCLETVCDDIVMIDNLKRKAFSLAEEKLDYAVLSRRYLR